MKDPHAMPAKNYVTPSSLDPMAAAEYAPTMELPDLKDDPHLKLVRPLVEAYQAFWLADNRHIRSLKLTPSQFDVIATLGDTDGMTCSELSARTLVTKGTLTGVLDRLVAKGLIRRESVDSDRRRIRIQLTEKGDRVFRKTYAAHIGFLKPFFEQALSPKEVDDARRLLLRLRDSFKRGTS
jgi:DNA-binding MarR family transcriptional regulator